MGDSLKGGHLSKGRKTLDGAILQIDQFHSNYSGFRKIGMHTFDKRDFGRNWIWNFEK